MSSFKAKFLILQLMVFPRNITRYPAYLLMWVMLLCAVALPGPEQAVYTFLAKGPVTKAAPVTGSSEDGQHHASVKQQIVKVFAEATISSTFVLSPQQAFRNNFQLFNFVPPVVDQPARRPHFLVAVLLARILPASLQSNAP